MFVTKLKIVTAFVMCAGLLVALIGGSLPNIGMAQNRVPPKAPIADAKAPKGENDEAFIRRISKDLRGTDPSPAEVHFFVSNSDTGKRQKLIDLFIQERQARQKTAVLADQIILDDFHHGILLKATVKNCASCHGADDKQALWFKKEYKHSDEIEQALKERDELKDRSAWSRRMVDLGYLDKKQADADADKLRDVERVIERLADAHKDRKVAIRESALQPYLLVLQSRYVSANAAAKDKKAVAAAAQEYVDALTKYVKDQPKASDVPDAILQIEMVYRALGKNVEAQAWGEKLQREYPDNPATRSWRKLLESSPSQPPQPGTGTTR
jgi:hypothetical protein